MALVLKNSWALLLGMFLLMLGNGVQGTLLGVRGAIESIPASTMSLVMSAYFIGFLGGSRLAPELIRRVGHVRVFAALASMVSAARSTSFSMTSMPGTRRSQVPVSSHPAQDTPTPSATTISLLETARWSTGSFCMLTSLAALTAPSS